VLKEISIIKLKIFIFIKKKKGNNMNVDIRQESDPLNVTNASKHLIDQLKERIFLIDNQRMYKASSRVTVS